MKRGRLTRWDAVALVAAFALVLLMAMDWYSTKKGEDLRRDEKLVEPGPLGGEIEPSTEERLAEAAEKEERNAWQADAFVDRLLLIVLLAAAATAVAAALRRGAGAPPSAGLTPSAVAAWLGLVGTVLVTYRILQAPGDDDIAVIKVGAPLALLAVGTLALGSRFAALAEREAAQAGPPGDSAASSGDDSTASGATAGEEDDALRSSR